MTLLVRAAGPADLGAIDALLARSYPVLLKPDYPPSIMVTALPIISRANPALVGSGTYFVVEDMDGGILAAGGWTPGRPGAGRATGHVRHVVTDHRRTRQGIAGRLLRHVMRHAATAGMSRMHCLSTRTAVPFYQAMGFVPMGPRDVQLRPGIVFPSVEMQRLL
jgi:GNAT superfamily N-acetyltransferase